MARRRKSSNRPHDLSGDEISIFPRRMILKQIFGEHPPSPFSTKQSRWYGVIQRMGEGLPADLPLLNDSKQVVAIFDRLIAEINTRPPSEIEAEFPYWSRAVAGHSEKRRHASLVARKDLYTALNDLRLAAREQSTHVKDFERLTRTEERDQWVAKDREINIRGTQALARFDKALLKCVGASKKTLGLDVIRALIAAAEVLGDNNFFEELSLAVRRKITPHKSAKKDIAVKAAALLDDGLSWQEAYDRLLEAGEVEPIELKEFYKLLQRHGVIPRKKQKPSR